MDSETSDIAVIALGSIYVLAASLSPFLIRGKRLQYLCTFTALFAAGLVANISLTFKAASPDDLPKYVNPIISVIHAIALIIPILLGTSSYVISTTYKVLTVRLMTIPFLAGASQAFILIQSSPFSSTVALVMFILIPAANVVCVAPQSHTARFILSMFLALLGSAIDIYVSPSPTYTVFLVPATLVAAASLFVLEYEGAMEIFFAAALGCACVSSTFLVALTVCSLGLALVLLGMFPTRNKFRYSLLILMAAVAVTIRLDGLGANAAVAVIGRELSLGLFILLLLTVLLTADEKFGSLAVLCLFLVAKHITAIFTTVKDSPLDWINLAILGVALLAGFMAKWRYRFMLLLGAWLACTVVHSVQISTVSAQMVIALVVSCLGLSSTSKAEFFSLFSVVTLVTVNLAFPDVYLVRGTVLNSTMPSLALVAGFLAFIATERPMSENQAVMDEVEFQEKLAESDDS